MCQLTSGVYYLLYFLVLVYWAPCHLYSYHLQIKTFKRMAQNLLLAIPEQLRLGNVLLLQVVKKYICI